MSEFDISPSERIAFMIDTDGFAVEVVPPQPELDPPLGAYTYTIGFPNHTGFPDIVVFGLTPVATRGLLGVVADTLRAGTEIPIGQELVGLLDNDLRAVFAAVDTDAWGALFAQAADWYGDATLTMVQLLYPDRNGFLPYEPGYDRRLRFAQPVIATF